MKDVTVIDCNKFTFLRNCADDIMLMIEAQTHKLNNPALVYTSANKYYLMFNSKTAIRLNLSLGIENHIKKAEDILVVEVNDGTVEREYRAVVKKEENYA